eukprot:Sdes_comp20361_c0_seq2m14158
MLFDVDFMQFVLFFFSFSFISFFSSFSPCLVSSFFLVSAFIDSIFFSLRIFPSSASNLSIFEWLGLKTSFAAFFSSFLYGWLLTSLLFLGPLSFLFLSQADRNFRIFFQLFFFSNVDSEKKSNSSFPIFLWFRNHFFVCIFFFF